MEVYIRSVTLNLGLVVRFLTCHQTKKKIPLYNLVGNRLFLKIDLEFNGIFCPRRQQRREANTHLAATLYDGASYWTGRKR